MNNESFSDNDNQDISIGSCPIFSFSNLSFISLPEEAKEGIAMIDNYLTNEIKFENSFKPQDELNSFYQIMTPNESQVNTINPQAETSTFQVAQPQVESNTFKVIHPQGEEDNQFHFILPRKKTRQPKSARPKRQRNTYYRERLIGEHVIINYSQSKYFSLDIKKSRVVYQNKKEKITYAYVHLPSPVDYELMIDLIKEHMQKKSDKYGKSYHLFHNSEGKIIVGSFTQKREEKKWIKLNRTKKHISLGDNN